MNPNGALTRLCRWLGPALLAGILTGCATTPRIDWNARIGSYIYDQAVLELGPPDKWAKLEDQTVVAEWLTHRGYNYVYGSFGYPYWYGPYYPGIYPSYAYSYSPDYFLRLTFGPDGKLKTWKKFAR